MGTTLLITESYDWQPLDERYCELDGEAREADMSDFPGRLEQSAMVRMETFDSEPDGTARESRGMHVTSKEVVPPKRLEMNARKVTIVMADDDEDDCLLFKEALEESCLKHNLRCFANGKELMDYLRRCGDYEGADVPRPDLIVLDLNMPVMDGRTTLQEIKEDPELVDIHVMILTESRDDADLLFCYNLGAHTFLTKAEWFDVLVEVVKTAGDYWFDCVCPGRRKNAEGGFPIGSERGFDGYDTQGPNCPPVQ